MALAKENKYGYSAVVKTQSLTVGDLKKYLASISDDTLLVIGNDEGWYDNIAGLTFNGEHDSDLAIVIEVGDSHNNNPLL